MMDINLKAPMRLTRAFAPAMVSKVGWTLCLGKGSQFCERGQRAAGSACVSLRTAARSQGAACSPSPSARHKAAAPCTQRSMRTPRRISLSSPARRPAKARRTAPIASPSS